MKKKNALFTIVLLAITVLCLPIIKASNEPVKKSGKDAIGLNIANNNSQAYTLVITGPTNMTVNVPAHSSPSVGPFIPGTYTFTMTGCLGHSGSIYFNPGQPSYKVATGNCGLQISNATFTTTSFFYIN